MTDAELAAIASIRLSWAPTPDDVWKSQHAIHVTGLHDEAFGDIVAALEDATRSDGPSPIGVALRGPAGSGKTHLLSRVREAVQDRGGYFFLIELLEGKSFWRSTLTNMLDDLLRETPTAPSQLHHLIDTLAVEAEVPEEVRAAVTGATALTPAALDSFVTAVYDRHPRYRRRSQHILRALVLTLAGDLFARDLAEAYLMCIDDLEAADLREWGIRLADLGHQEITENLSRLLALTGPSVLALDQIDTLLAQSRATAVQDGSAGADDDLVLEHIAHGLMSLRQTMSRTASVVACLPTAWEAIENNATASVPDRFRVSAALRRIAHDGTSRSIVAKRFATSYRDRDFTPPYPTWPIAESAFATAVEMTPRNLLIAVDNHIRQCLRTGAVAELQSFTQSAPAPQPPSDDPAVDAVAARFEQLRSTADVDRAFQPATEDEALPRLLGAGLRAWIQENPVVDGAFLTDPPPSTNPPLHARLRHILNENEGDEQHFAFRGISASHARSVQSRIDKACSSAGLTGGVDRRRLVVIRNTPWPSGAVTTRKVNDFAAAGGQTVQLSSDDARTLVALDRLYEENPPALAAWLDRARPAHGTTLFADVLPTLTASEPEGGAAASTPGASATTADAGASAAPTGAPSALPTGAPATAGRPTPEDASSGNTEPKEAAKPLRIEQNPDVDSAGSVDVAPPGRIPLGQSLGVASTVSVELEALRKHVAIFAGSGSGKTVLLRRIVEECALQGVSSIVLDINNDLARLGEGWPTPPGGWVPGDDNKSRRYLERTDVVVWTPGRQSGNPLVFQPLPRFADVRDNPDELHQAQQSAFAALAPRARAVGSTPKAQHLAAVLHTAVGWLSRRENPDMATLVDLLEDFPEGLSPMSNAVKLAAEMAENLKAAMVNDPLFAGTGESVDPGLLLTPPEGKDARISVINLSGLSTDDQKQNFITQLQMALFAWIKKNPAGETVPLRGIYVLDEAQNYVPSGSMTVCKPSTLALVSQARKYGLGMVFATQKPKGLDTSVPGNCDTQFFGKLNAQAQIDTVRELARFKGGDVGAIGALKVGNFYLGLGSTPFQRITAPNCLSYHPASPPTEDEVLDIARAKRELATS